ncbi:MAG TPA: tRNA (adenosine(37)-N6)-dimethylallyltransferase MiaA [Terriglobales bacterium]|nr:tRNA (adenosine(37)-N6)-dimethylallyltransferase MiaA [Terriglobales bacterium]
MTAPTGAMRSSAQSKPLLLVIVGPTASGKSALAVELATRFCGEIVSCDSVALYRHLEIGAAKPTREQRAAVPHHLIDIADPGEPFTAGEYSRRARAVIAEITRRGRLPMVVGGSGLYLRALLEGLFPGPQRSEPLRRRLRERVAERGSPYLHSLLARLDPASAARIHANDASKLIRAIEVCLAARARMSELWRERGREQLRGFRILQIGLNPPREKLYERINQRARQMFADGLVEETRLLLERYANVVPAKSLANADQYCDTGCLRSPVPVTPLDSLGYRQARQYLQGDLTLEQAIAAAQQGHRNYAKRQMTWFRREPEVKWLEGFGDDPAIVRQAAEIVSLNY